MEKFALNRDSVVAPDIYDEDEGADMEGMGGGPGLGTGDPGGGGPGGGGGREFDLMALFLSRDADGDGKLAGDEIPDGMKERLDSIDTDGDDAISLEEIEARVSSRRGGGGRSEGREQRPGLESDDDEAKSKTDNAEDGETKESEPESS